MEAAPQFSHRDLVNVVLSLQFSTPGWPRVLGDLQYLVYRVGSAFPCSALGSGGLVCPDVVCAAPARSLAVLWEAKSGAVTDREQTEKLLRVTSDDLHLLGQLPRPAAGIYRIGVVQLCNAQHFSRRVEDCQSYACSLVAPGPEGFLLAGSESPDPELAAGLRGARFENVPWAFIPYDRHSPVSEVIPVISGHVVAALLSGAGTLSPESIVRQTHAIVFEAMRSTGSGGESAEVVDKVRQILKEGSRNELREWLEKLPKTPDFRVLKGISTEPAARTRELKALEKAMEELAARLGAPLQQMLPFVDPDAE